MLTPLHTLRRFYRWNAPIYDLTRWPLLRGRRAAVSAMQLSPGNRVLEIGCGTGANLTRLARALGEHPPVVGVDLSHHMLRRARRRHPRARLIQADAARMPLNVRFDVILVSYALSMIPDWQTALAQARDLLDPGGRMVILDFAHCGAQPTMLGAMFAGYLRWNHVCPRRDLQGAMEKRGLRTEELDSGHRYLTLLRGFNSRE
ncbi:MAG: methyltransferase domain-containing protein [bacterium]|nr:methyltransferase domain-containing protein [bacterium]